MDKLEFKIMSPYDEGEYWAVHYNYTDTLGTRILVNGKDLVGLVNEAIGETRHGHVEPRLIYFYLKSAELEREEAFIGRCNGCGDIGDNPIFCRVYTTDKSVKWIVGRRYKEKMFAFTFDRGEYDMTLAELRRLGLEYGETANPENIERDVALYYGVEEQFGTLADYLYMRGYSDEVIEEVLKEHI